MGKNRRQYTKEFKIEAVHFWGGSWAWNCPEFITSLEKEVWERGKCEKEKYDAKQAQQMVADILKDAEQITLKNMERGKYFRIAADVIIDGESLGDMLIEASGDGQRIEGESTLSLYFILGELDGTCNFFY